MRTIIIYDDMQSAPKFFIVDEDVSRFHGILFNSGISNPFEEECLNWLFYDDGNYRYDMSEDISILESKDWDKVALISFIP